MPIIIDKKKLFEIMENILDSIFLIIIVIYLLGMWVLPFIPMFFNFDSLSIKDIALFYLCIYLIYLSPIIIKLIVFIVKKIILFFSEVIYYQSEEEKLAKEIDSELDVIDEEGDKYEN